MCHVTQPECDPIILIKCGRGLMLEKAFPELGYKQQTSVLQGHIAVVVNIAFGL